jgi:hypothetical protein
MPPEAKRLWQRYTAGLRNPPPPKRIDRIVSEYTGPLGITVKNMPEYHPGAEKVHSWRRMRDAVLVVAVRPGSLAAAHGPRRFLRSISHVDGKPTTSIRQYAAAVEMGDLKKGIRLQGYWAGARFDMLIRETGNVLQRE